MSDVPKLPYIKRLELEKQQLTDALVLVQEYHKAMEFASKTGYKADAYRKADEIKTRMNNAINEALNTTGG